MFKSAAKVLIIIFLISSIDPVAYADRSLSSTLAPWCETDLMQDAPKQVRGQTAAQWLLETAGVSAQRLCLRIRDTGGQLSWDRGLEILSQYIVTFGQRVDGLSVQCRITRAPKILNGENIDELHFSLTVNGEVHTRLARWYPAKGDFEIVPGLPIAPKQKDPLPEEYIYQRDGQGNLVAEPVGYPGTWVVDTHGMPHDKYFNAKTNRIMRSVSIVMRSQTEVPAIERGYIHVIEDINRSKEYLPEGAYDVYGQGDVRIFISSSAKRIWVCLKGGALLEEPLKQRGLLTAALKDKRGTLNIKGHRAASPGSAPKNEMKPKRPRVLLFNDINAEESDCSVRSPVFYLASALRAEGIDVEISKFPIQYYASFLKVPKSELSTHPLWAEVLASLDARFKKIMEQKYDVIGCSLYYGSNLKNLEPFFERLRSCTDAVLAVGGPMPTLSPENTLAHMAWADLIYRGEGDLGFPKVVRAIAESGGHINEKLADALAEVSGIWLRRDGIALSSGLDEQNSLDVKAHDGINLDYSFLEEDGYADPLRLMTARGCFRNCGFCSHVHGRAVRQWSAEKTVDTILAYQDHLEKAEASGIEVQDDAWEIIVDDDDFFINPKRAIDILSRLERLNEEGRLKVRLVSLQGSIESFMVEKEGGREVNHDLISALGRASTIFIAGKAVVDLGTDAFSDREIARLRKGKPGKPYTFREIEAVVSALEEASIQNNHYLILTDPWTEDEDVAETLLNVASLMEKYLLFSIAEDPNQFVFPTELIDIYKKVQMEGREKILLGGNRYALDGFKEYDTFEGGNLVSDRLNYFDIKKRPEIFESIADAVNGSKAVKLRAIVDGYELFEGAGVLPQTVSKKTKISPEDYIYRRNENGDLIAEPIGYPGTWVVDTHDMPHDKYFNAKTNRIMRSVAAVMDGEPDAPDIARGYIHVVGTMDAAISHQPEGDYEVSGKGDIRIFFNRSQERLWVYVKDGLLSEKPERQRELLRSALVDKRGLQTFVGVSDKRLPVTGSGRKNRSKKPRVLLFNDVGDLEGKAPTRPPALHLASALRAQGVDVEISKFPVYLYGELLSMPEEELSKDPSYARCKEELDLWLADIAGSGYDVIGLSLYVDEYAETTQKLLSKLRAMTSATIAIGGPLPTLSPENTLAHMPQADLVFRGEGELAFPKIVKALHASNGNITEKFLDEIEGVSGFWLRRNGIALASGISEKNALTKSELEKVVLDFSFLDDEEWGFPLNIMSSRGCSRKCAFCSHVHKGAVRQWSVKKTVGTIMEYQTYLEQASENGIHVKAGAWNVVFDDDDFFANPKRAMAILKELKKLYDNGRLKIRLGVLTGSIESFIVERGGARTVNQELINTINSTRDLFADGVWPVTLGTDAFADCEIRRLQKGRPGHPYTFHEICAVVDALEKAGIESRHFLIMTNPWTEDADMARTIENVAYLFEHFPSFFLASKLNHFIIPDQLMEIYKKVQREGREEIFEVDSRHVLDGFDEYDTFENGRIFPDRLRFFNPENNKGILDKLEDAFVKRDAAALRSILEGYRSSVSAARVESAMIGMKRDRQAVDDCLLLGMGCKIDHSGYALVIRKGMLEKTLEGKEWSFKEPLMQRYRIMEQTIEKMLGCKIIEAAPDTDPGIMKQNLLTAVRQAQGADRSRRVIILDDGILTGTLVPGDIDGAAGEDYCVIQPEIVADAQGLPFVNILDMLNMGIGVFEIDSLPALFSLAYRSVTGQDAPLGLVKAIKEKRSGRWWMVPVLPRLIPLDVDLLKVFHELQKMFEEAA